MTRNIFIDLDGTLIDPRQRLYALFQELVPASRLSLDEYWEIKRRRVDQNRLLGEWFSYDEGQIAIFKEEWLAKVFRNDQVRQRSTHDPSKPKIKTQQMALANFCQAIFALNEFIYVD